MHRVVLLREDPLHLDELEAHELEAPLFEPGEDATHEQALDAVGLDEQEGALEIGHGASCASRVAGRVVRTEGSVTGTRRPGPVDRVGAGA